MESMELAQKDLFGGVFRNKRVLVTGHTGFKGSWLSMWLDALGAKVIGYALPPASDYGNFVLCGLKDKLTDLRGDVCDRKRLAEIFDVFQPEIVFHLAAQPIVRKSYRVPAETFETNVMGCVNLLENVRKTGSVRSCVIVTSDKCYENREQIWGYRESDAMGGYDPYSASKGCAELVASAYRRSFSMPVATARAGNVIGGGDWSEDRLLPDCIRSLRKGEPVGVRNPDAVRPWQFVLEPLYGYLLLAAGLLSDPQKTAEAWNFGPCGGSLASVGEVADAVIGLWGDGSWEDLSDPDSDHEASFLNLDCTKANALLGWFPQLSLKESLGMTMEWYRGFERPDVSALCLGQIRDYTARVEESRGKQSGEKGDRAG
ncbi:CDP-glucose 4,6-dehydratase [Caprobacter fermentans]|uniref:CDP-glucose 4,6-dehydratase n=2 Tax=Caproicibacter fermentans TaxID=2576756 RepID=A0A6N8HWZ7_9FIRM|nr:CDP-glucose 4,6-dehydratase [Caproicibacter fermentans]